MSFVAEEDMDIAEWLAAIHLERYKDNFKQHGYKRVKDILLFDNQLLQQIGVNATGHRKRIISRLQNKSGEFGQPSGSDLIESEDSQQVSERDNDINNKTVSQATTEEIVIRSGLQNSIYKVQCEPNTRPVPKPRTVFNKTSTIVNKEPLGLQATVSLSSSLENHATASGNNVLQECPVSRGNSFENEDCNSCVGPQPERVELEVGESKHSSAGAGKPFHPTPLLLLLQNKVTSQPGTSIHRNLQKMDVNTMQGPPLSPLLSLTVNGEEIPSQSNSPPPQEMLTMINNEIYSGLGARTSSISFPTGTESQKNNLNLKPPDMIKQEATPAPERLKSPQMRKSASLKPSQMRNSTSPTPGWIRDSISQRPAPIGNSASPQVSRVKNTGPVSPLPVGNNVQHMLTQRKSNVSPVADIPSIAYTAASRRPNPVGDSGSPRLPRTVQNIFPRPPPIGHSSSPRLPRLRNSSSPNTNSLRNDDLSMSTLTNETSSKLVKKKSLTSRQDVIGNSSLPRKTSVLKNTFLRPATQEKRTTRAEALMTSDISHRPTPVGNAGSSAVTTGNIPQQKSLLVRYTAPPRPSLLKSSSSHLSPVKTVFSPTLDITEQDSSRQPKAIQSHISKRPTTIGNSPSSTLKKSFLGNSALRNSSSTPFVKNSQAPTLDIGKPSTSHNASLEMSVNKLKPSGILPRTKCFGNVATLNIKDPERFLRHSSMEKEQNSKERKKEKGSISMLKQKPVEKISTPVKSSGSITFQRPKQVGKDGLQLSKSRSVVVPSVSQSSFVSRTKPAGNVSSPIPKLTRNGPLPQSKQQDNVVPRPKSIHNSFSIKPQPTGNIAPVTSKLRGNISGNSRPNIATLPQKTTSRQILPKLPFMQKKSSPKSALIKNPHSKAEDNEYLLFCPNRTDNSYSLQEEQSSSPVSLIEHRVDLQKLRKTPLSLNLMDDLYESAVKANTPAYKPTHDDHLELVIPKLRRSYLKDNISEQ